VCINTVRETAQEISTFEVLSAASMIHIVNFQEARMISLGTLALVELVFELAFS
jgi:hypothetical protein